MSLDVPSKNCYFIYAKRAESLKFSRHVLEINSDPTHAPDFRFSRFGGLRRESSGEEYQRVQTVAAWVWRSLKLSHTRILISSLPVFFCSEKVNSTLGNLISDPTHATDFSVVPYFTQNWRILSTDGKEKRQDFHKFPSDGRI